MSAAVAVPPVGVGSTSTEPPTFVPPDAHAVATSLGPQTKKSTVPDAGPSFPLRVAVSVTEPPMSIDESLTLVVIFGGTQVSKLPPLKSFRVAVTDCDERVSAKNDEKQGALPSKSLSRSIPPSKNDSGGIRLFVPATALSSKFQLGLMSSELVTAHALSTAGASVHFLPSATRFRLPSDP